MKKQTNEKKYDGYYSLLNNIETVAGAEVYKAKFTQRSRADIESDMNIKIPKDNETYFWYKIESIEAIQERIKKLEEEVEFLNKRIDNDIIFNHLKIK